MSASSHRWASGIDIGQMAIRAVVMHRVQGQWQLHAFTEVPRFYGGSGQSLDEQLAELTTKIALKGPVYVSDSTINIMVRYVNSVPLPVDRLQRLVYLDLQQHADEHGDLAADMYVLPLGGDELVVCCPLAQPAEVCAILDALKKVSVCTAAICLPALTTFNALRHHFTREEQHTAYDYETSTSASVVAEEAPAHRYHLLIDIGARQTRLTVSRDDEFLINRSLSFGGWDFTRALTENETLSIGEAEKNKIAGVHARPAQGAEGASHLGADDTDNLFDDDADDLFADDADDLFGNDASDKNEGVDDSDDDLFADDNSMASMASMAPVTAARTDEHIDADINSFTMEDMAQETVEEETVPAPGLVTRAIGAQQLGEDVVRTAEQLYVHIASSLKWFNAQLDGINLEIDAAHVCGEGGRLTGLTEYLAHRLHVPVNRISFDTAISEGATGVLSVYSSAIGAALQCEREHGQGAVAFDLRPESILRREAWRREIIWPRIAAGLLVCAALLWAWTMSQQHSAAQADVDTFKQHSAQRRASIATLTALKQERQAVFEDVRGIAGRIYAGRDLLNAVRALKEEAPQDLWVITFRTENINNEAAADGEQRTGRGRRQPARGATRGATASAQHGDTAVNRGSIYVSGSVRPQKALATSEFHRQFQTWYESVAAWKEYADGAPLFQSSHIERLLTDFEKDRVLTFEVKFEFQKTSLKDVESIVESTVSPIDTDTETTNAP